MGLYNYDETVLSKFKIPERLDRDTVIGSLLMELAELEVIFPDINTMRTAIGFWSNKKIQAWEKLLDTTLLDYNPIMNYDRTEEVERKETRDLHKTDNENRDLRSSNTEERDLENESNEIRDLTETNNQTNTNSDTITNSGSDNVTESSPGFNESGATLRTATQTTRGTSATNNGTVTANGSVNDNGTVTINKVDVGTIEYNGTDKGTVNRVGTDSGDIKHKISSRVFGNIGVTTTQYMIDEERHVAVFNVIDVIVSDFKKQFCILVY